MRSFRNLSDRAVAAIERNLTSYDLFALAVLFMIIGHLAYYFDLTALWPRVPDRMFVPVFLVLAGYNVGRKTNDAFVFAAVAMMIGEIVFVQQVFPVNILFTIILMRCVINRVMDWALKSKLRFWGLNIALVPAFPLTNMVFEYGSIALVMAMAGWISRNREEIPLEIVKPHRYFIFAGLMFLASTQYTFQFSAAQLVMVALGLCVMMKLLYDFRILLMNGLKRKPRDVMEKTCSFIGHKGLEIYVAHSLIFQALQYYALHKLKG